MHADLSTNTSLINVALVLVGNIGMMDDWNKYVVLGCISARKVLCVLAPLRVAKSKPRILITVLGPFQG